MNLESIRKLCMSFPHATEKVQWGDDLVFKIGGKMFAVVVLPSERRYPVVASFKCTPEEFTELTERAGIIPAPYSARYHWVALERFDALPSTELQRLLRDSYDLVRAKLPAKTLRELTQIKPRKMKKTAR